MNTSRIQLAVIALTLAAAGAGPALASPAQSVEKTKEICTRETRATEQAMGIPAHLLGAIALAESGRWDAEAQASFAWPWTVTAEGKGRYFPTKAEALAEVRRLMKRGLTNIDVGCMQINLYYHGGAFTDVAEAMDPAANTAYAGQYLKNLFASTGSWTQAAGYYHSMTPDRGDAYREKVVDLWKQNRRLARAAPADETAEPDRRDAAGVPAKPSRPAGAATTPATAPVSIDMARTAALNARLRLARSEERALDFATRRQQELAYLREAQAAGLPTQNLSLMRRAHAEAERQHELAAQPSRSTRFAERRRSQLQRWREARARDDSAS